MLEKLLIAINASLHAGGEIMKIYNSEFDVEYKEDESPLTMADKNAHDLIEGYLLKTNIHILSEEGKHESYDVRKKWNELWIVDPLDGTKEFVKRNGEFTVNIALVENNIPVIGVIYVAATNVLYFAESEIGAFKIVDIKPDFVADSLSDLLSIAKQLPLTKSNDIYTVVGSRSHQSADTQEYFNSLRTDHGDIKIMSIGSSLKLCMVAEGIADEYPRYAPTMEWDIAAGQAIVTASGGKVIDYETKKTLLYNRENLLNPWFTVSSSNVLISD
ncbi:MAG: 3'(2'),5'-bisphosphate nucleotidase CysQ [Ichthyobacteriaceae bacterium]|nr:3'(2'),5'-bisphosphate nucleotidase CysQ [Ichthyobacteriaceae bacterium]